MEMQLFSMCMCVLEEIALRCVAASEHQRRGAQAKWCASFYSIDSGMEGSKGPKEKKTQKELSCWSLPARTPDVS